MTKQLDILTVKEAAEYLSLTEETVRETCRRGDLKAHKINRRWRIPRKNLNAYVRGEEQEDPEPSQEDETDSGDDSYEYSTDVPF